jgi:hypothetical protein
VTVENENEGLQYRLAWAKKGDPISTITTVKKDGDTVELLPSKCKALSSNSRMPPAPSHKKRII